MIANPTAGKPAAATYHETEDPSSHIEATALLVAASRAVEARKPSPLATDGFAEILVTSASDEWAGIFKDPGPIADLLGAGEFGKNFVNYQGARTKLFDAFCADASYSGIRQVVILAAGLDSRAFRLEWPTGTTIYELDRRNVLEFKSAVLAAAGAEASAKRIQIAIDLQEDWPAALQQAGFATGLPTAWLVEGLMMYLPPPAEFDLLERILALSAAGSRAAIEHMDRADIVPDNPENSPQKAQLRDLFENVERADPIQWFRRRGWRSKGRRSLDLLADLGRPCTLTFNTPIQTMTFVYAELPED
jgi:methyltransferase (TIGR00027 family)